MAETVPHQRVRLDENFIAIPLEGDEMTSISLCLVVRKESDPVEGPFCRIHQRSDVNVFLGCFIDMGGHVVKWLELWVRDYDNIAESLHENAFDIINNAVLDVRWKRQGQMLRLSQSSHLYSTTLDADMECPLYIDVFHKRAIFPKDEESKTHWKICKEDNLLDRIGLAPYSTTVHRYLYLETLGPDSCFLPITPNAPVNEKTMSLDRVVSVRSTLLPFSRYGGSILVRAIAPMSLDGYLDVVGGRPWDGLGQGLKKLLPKGVYREIGDEVAVGYATGRLLTARSGTRTWNLESLYLKSRLFAEVIALVKRCVELDKKPFFCLETSSFGVNLPVTSQTSPFLWDAELALNQTSEAVDFSVEKQTDLDSRETTYFRTFRPLPASIYRPEALGQQRSLIAEISLLKIERDRESGLYEIHGTMRSPDLEDASFVGRHLYFINYPIRGRRLRMVAEMSGADVQLADKIHIKTRKLLLGSEEQTAVESFLGVEQRGVYCEVLPMVGTPCDLYSLAIIGLELLYHGSGAPLALLKDRLFTVGAACLELGPAQPLAERVAKVIREDPQLREVLLPEALGLSDSSSGRIGLPAEDRIWEGMLALLLRMVPGLLKGEGIAPNLSNENNFRLAHVFDEAFDEIAKTAAILRSLCVGDIHGMQLVRKVLDEMITGIGGNRNG